MSVNLLLSLPPSICLPISLSCIHICLSFLLSVRLCIFTQSPLICIYFIRFYVYMHPCVNAGVCVSVSLYLSCPACVKFSQNIANHWPDVKPLCCFIYQYNGEDLARLSGLRLPLISEIYSQYGLFLPPGLRFYYGVWWLKMVPEEGGVGVPHKPHL